MEDKGSCIVRMHKKDYESNAKSNLSKGNQYEKLNNDPTKETVEKVVNFVKNLQTNDEIKDTTAEVAKTEETHPGSYTEQPKTHKFDEDTHDISEGFPALGIISCRNTPTG